MPGIPLPKGLRGERNSYKQRETLRNLMVRGDDLLTLAPRPGVDFVINGIGRCRGAVAARCASGTKLAVIFRSTRRSSRISTCRSAG